MRDALEEEGDDKVNQEEEKAHQQFPNPWLPPGKRIRDEPLQQRKNQGRQPHRTAEAVGSTEPGTASTAAAPVRRE
jgi:hypothetical protein